jgi:hypothetical protein
VADYLGTKVVLKKSIQRQEAKQEILDLFSGVSPAWDMLDICGSKELNLSDISNRI